MDIRCEHYSTYTYYSYLVTSTIKRTCVGTLDNAHCLCNMMTPNASGHDQHTSRPYYASINCKLTITRCPLVT